ncbi:paired amphipathic helix protein Sin3a [Clonorchis sinensis]|uniref:Paired amphipathic helix protein Sin3a n=1 Tax=Clonorchis sinensis TaxID=79923 RepID=G7YTB6_CLOSI|nr:paired amphipathic helix protein Sin3a [Clonorchis sinensis]
MMKYLKVEDALSYLDEVKERFAGQGAIYTDFLDVMREFKMQTIGTEVVIRRVRELFEGHTDLIVGFNNFIPQAYRMDAPVSRCPPTNIGVRNSGTPAIENISPPKKSSTKSADNSADWEASAFLSSVPIPHDTVSRQSAYSPSVTCISSGHDNLPPRSNNVASSDQSIAATSQVLLTTYNEGLQTQSFRGAYSVACGAGAHPTVPSTNVYHHQQQQQVQSFNHALHYVNKIKNRFQGVPNAYQRFLDILQWYQREQRHADPSRRKLAEKQVYQDVAKLFDGQEDLLQEFGQFLPESTGVTNAVTENLIGRKSTGQSQSNSENSPESVPLPQTISRISEGLTLTLSSRQRQDSTASNATAPLLNVDLKKLKRLAPAPQGTPCMSNNALSTAPKKCRPAVRDVSVTDVNQLAGGVDVSLLHKVRHVFMYIFRLQIRSVLCTDNGSDRAYQTFLQALNLFNRNELSADELLQSVRPLFPRHPDVWRRLCDTVSSASPTGHGSAVASERDREKHDREFRLLSSNVPSAYDIQPDANPGPPLTGGGSAIPLLDVGHKRLDLDFMKLRTCGTSYRALPSNFPQSKCSGRLKCPIAREVLNDSYISFSSLTSEDSQFVSSKKNQYEEHMYRVEDERYEVDMVTELNRAAMQNLVVVKRRMDRMGQDELNRMISASLTQRCLTVRTDLKTPGTFGSALINVNEGYKENGAPHLALVYPPPATRNLLLEDAASLIIHHVKRQSNTSKEDKRTMKYLMRTVVQDLFMAERFPMSDDEEDEDEDEEEMLEELPDGEEGNRTRSSRQSRLRRAKESRKSDVLLDSSVLPDEIPESDRLEEARCGSPDMYSSKFGSRHACEMDSSCFSADQERHTVNNFGSSPGLFPPMDGRQSPSNESHQMEDVCGANFPKEEHYSLLYGSNHWYAFLRLHHLLLCRLHLFRSRSLELSMQAASENNAPVQAAEVLRLKRCGGVDPSDYYSRALKLVKDFLDGGEDVTVYEDRLRDMFGIYAYPWFTLDRLVNNIVRQLHALASGDELSHRLTSLHRSWVSGSTCSSPFPSRHIHTPAVAPGAPHGIRGPLCTRVCRLANEAAYRSQALAVISSCHGQSGGSNWTQPGPVGPVGSCSQTNNSNQSVSASNNIPNCYAIVMLSEASTMLIRLISPTVGSAGYDSSTVPHVCLSSHRPAYPAPSSAPSASSVAPSGPARHWFDYLNAHLVWTIGYVPRDVYSHIRPVFLYRTVRRCVKALTYAAYRRRQQQLVETGDTQPEEATGTDTESACSSRNAESASSSSSITFEHDVWEFMCHVFKSDLTRKELFRDTFSSDCMQSTDRLTAKSAPRTHKINWSVGSYGIFIRRKRRHLLRGPSPRKWHAFHARWILEHASPDETVSSQLPKLNPTSNDDPVVSLQDETPGISRWDYGYAPLPCSTVEEDPDNPSVEPVTTDTDSSIHRGGSPTRRTDDTSNQISIS